MNIEMNDELFLQLTECCNRADNGEDNTRRAKVQGFTGEGVIVAPGSIIRLKDFSKVGHNGSTPKRENATTERSRSAGWSFRRRMKS